MPSVSQLTHELEEFMLAPRRGPGVCRRCFNLTDGYDWCWPCLHGGHCLDAVAPISYSVSGGPLHAMLAGYKRMGGPQARACEIRLAAVLARYLKLHERCIAQAAAVDYFDLVTTVPSSDRERDANHPLRRVVGQLTEPVGDRYHRLLRRSAAVSRPREFDVARFEICEAVGGSVLLIDDTWTTGASAQSAAATLTAAGATAVAAVVIGRYLNEDWQDNRTRLRRLPRPFRWERCALERCEREHRPWR
jgi:predicted amidophosphoribosyltransferase